MELAGKVAVVIGGSGGIGAATCRVLAGLGADVAVGFHAGQARAEAVVASLPKGRHAALQVAIEDSASIGRFRDAVLSQFGRADILVNSAGITRPVAHADLDGLTDELIDAVFVNNWRGVFASIRAFAPALRASGDGLVVNVSSIAAASGAPGEYVHYAASKAAVEGFTVGLAREVAAQGIRVNAVAPGTTLTDIHAAAGEPDRPKRIAARVPMGRIARAEEIAEAVMWLLSERAGYVTGSVLKVAGGL